MSTLTFVGAPPVSQPSAGLPTLQAFFGNIQIGWDTSSNFALSLSGLAIRRPDGTYVAKERGGDRLLDVTALILAGVAPYVLRIPVSTVENGDLIITSDFPFSVLYVLRKATVFEGIVGSFMCLDPITGEVVHYAPQVNPFLSFFVRVVSLFDSFGWQSED